MSIFFWKKNKNETEPAAPEPAVTAEAAPEVTEQITEEPAEAPAPAAETASAAEPAEAPAEAPAKEPAESPASDEAPAEKPASEPVTAETPEAEPAEEPAPDKAPAIVETPPALEEIRESEDIREYEKAPQSSASEEYDYEAAGLAENPIPVEVYEKRPYYQEENGPAYDEAAETAAAGATADGTAVSAAMTDTPRAQSEGSSVPPVPAYADDDDEDDGPPERGGGGALLLIFLLLMVIGGSYYYGYTYSQTHFLKNTYINGQDVSGMTSPEVEKIFSEKANGYELKIAFRDGEVEVIPGTEIGFKVKPDGSVDRILQSQDHRKWYMCFFRRTDGEVELKTTYDPDRLIAAVNALPELQKSRMVSPEDAYIELQETTFKIIPETEGNYINLSVVRQAAEEAVEKEEPEIDVASLKWGYRKPKVRSNDKEIVEKCEDLNHMLAGSITWELPSGDTMTLDKNTTVNWLSRDENGNYYRDEDLWEDNIEFWVDELARNVNTVGSTWYFHATNRGDMEINGGDYGYAVNKVSEREEVWDLLWDGDTDEREPYYYQQQYTRGRGIGSTYIEANLSAQHVWIYIDGDCVCQTDCVSGLPANGRGTPTGVFQILYKDTDTDLKGQRLANGEYSYISHVDYWMPFYNGCGFHDASWRSSFGGTIYKYDGSHGCINLPPSIAPTFYSYVRTGMPVVVFY